jgi:bifunctional DNA-binding transcriptional regulator/antitoxin component of YhaV-PrlF toxin-antitoxin module
MSYKLQVKQSNDQATITVPKAMRKAKNWKDGQELEWKLNEKGNPELQEKFR